MEGQKEKWFTRCGIVCFLWPLTNDGARRRQNRPEPPTMAAVRPEVIAEGQSPGDLGDWL